MAEAPRLFLVVEGYQSPYPSPILFHAGEQVTVGREFKDDPEWRDWVWCEGGRDNKAWAPKQYLDIKGDRGVFLTEYNALELSVEPGEELKVHQIVNGFAMAEKSDGRLGWVPVKNLTEVRSPQA